MKARVYLPQTAKEFKSQNLHKIKELWLRYFDNLPKAMEQRFLKILWYKIQCENHNLKIEQKHITKLNRYSTDPDKYIEKLYKAKYQIKSGTEIVKTFKGRKYKVIVKSENEYVYNNQAYKTLSAVAMVICGKKVSGYDFFGLNNLRATHDAENRINK